MNGRLDIGYTIRRDLSDVLAIEQEAFEFPYTEEEIVRLMRERSTVARVARLYQPNGNAIVVGYAFYQLHKTRTHLVSMAVAKDYRRQGIGRAFFDRIKSGLSEERRTRIFCEVRETNLGAQLFLRAMGMRAVGVIRNHYDSTSEDAYQFCYRYRASKEVHHETRQQRQ